MPFTLATPCDYQEVIRKSRFIAKAAPIAQPEDAQAFIQTVSDSTASHNCWAWKIGNQYRFSDDGEPGGTAGRPMLTAIEGQDCEQVVVVVTRWFGGIQLGTGGLARAYGGCAAKCLQAGERLPLVARVRCRCHCRFAELALLKACLGDHEALIESETFDAEGAELVLALPSAQRQGLQQLLADISRGRSRLSDAER
ncbi:thymidylate synthase [Stutzerimonas stutzeri]|uniref:Thymidylate synthase n=1 Tax=Stutzerimonas stutzeri TaxID=316 RepID=W8R1N5_STUST|nr:YigZ family protein [Stutzerimonas stutzeri]AHL76820.1 thymidylate synthase [Stutzerimonas stutzeri]MCQ4330997.1 IMPACT family protein [Stutzerimonas stutzeri]